MQRGHKASECLQAHRHLLKFNSTLSQGLLRSLSRHESEYMSALPASSGGLHKVCREILKAGSGPSVSNKYQQVP